jgi:ribonuclease BN (tRNA processing enzyme)
MRQTVFWCLGMKPFTVQFLGSGDAFGSGGRFQTCIHAETPSAQFLLDCGASSLIAMRRFGVDPARIDAILLTHLHGDHFGGLPFIILEAQLVSKRTRPLVIAGPPGTQARVRAAQEVLFSDSSRVQQKFRIEFVEIQERTPLAVAGLIVTAYPAAHASGAPSYALRIESGGKTLAYSGDTDWTDSLADAARRADLFICEAYFFEKRTKYHMNYRTLMENRAALNCRRLVLTHMSADLLSRLSAVEIESAEDGKKIVL